MRERHLVSNEGGCCHTRRSSCSLVTHFPLWTECYGTLVAVLSIQYAEKTPHFMAYLRKITHGSRTFEGEAWASHDKAHRRQAANQRSLDWGVLDPTLYNEAFTGRAKLIPRCCYCLADNYGTKYCAFTPEGQQ